jgi:hypothetical protein
LNGLITVLWGTLVFLVLPPSPMYARFLTEEERVLAVHRIRANNTGVLNRTLKWRQVSTEPYWSRHGTEHQVEEALNPFKDPQGLLLFLTIFCNEVLK